MPKFIVPLVRKTVELEWAHVEVEASHREDAVERAIELAEGAPSLMPDNHAFWQAHGNIVWSDRGSGYGGTVVNLSGSYDDVEEVEPEDA